MTMGFGQQLRTLLALVVAILSSLWIQQCRGSSSSLSASAAAVQEAAASDASAAVATITTTLDGVRIQHHTAGDNIVSATNGNDNAPPPRSSDDTRIRAYPKNSRLLQHNNATTTNATMSNKKSDHHRGRNNNTCTDLRTQCTSWIAADASSCWDNAAFMHAHCPLSCGVCHNRTITLPRSRSMVIRRTNAARRQRRRYDDNDALSKASIRHKNDVPKDLIQDAVGGSIGVPQVLDSDYRSEIVQLVEEAQDYVDNVVMYEQRYRPVRTLCRNRHSQCALWAAQGLCDDPDNEVYMREEACAPVCFSCEQLHVEAKCPYDYNAKNAWYPGDLHRMFTRITTDPAFAMYSPKALSRPTFATAEDAKKVPEDLDYIIGGPWVVVLENFTKAEEAAALIKLGQEQGYERSTDVGEETANGEFEELVSTGRTSTNTWCHDGCRDTPLVHGVWDRIEALTGIPKNNSEELQLLRYEPGQYYEEHHDFIFEEIHRVSGPRILTVFLYLNDVQAGGATRFTQLGLTVRAKLGRAVLWPSVLDSSPYEWDERTKHEALPVLEGMKYGANAWFHQRDVETPYQMGC